MPTIYYKSPTTGKVTSNDVPSGDLSYWLSQPNWTDTEPSTTQQTDTGSGSTPPSPVVSDPNTTTGNYRREGLVTPAKEVDKLYQKYFGRVGNYQEREYWIFRPISELVTQLEEDYKNSETGSGHAYDGTPILEGNQQSERDLNPETETAVDPRTKEYDDAIANNPAIKNATQGGSSLEEIIWAAENNDWSGVVDWEGKPFSDAQQQEALTRGMEDNRLFYQSQQAKETADAEASMAQQQSDYQNYLISSGQQFEADKTKIDQQAADRGVLFSGSRVQKERNMERAYNQDQDYTRNRVAGAIGKTARDFQYNYGKEPTAGLSQYYGLGGNTYNSNVARGGVGSSNLSNVYNPSNNSFFGDAPVQGRRNIERQANANTRAAGYLWNKGNKFLRTGNQNQY